MAETKNTRRVAILGGNRIPFARADGAYAHASNQDMFTAVLDGLADRFDLKGTKLDAVIGGGVVATIANGLGLLNQSSYINFLVTGGVLLLAASVDAISRRRRSSTGMG